VISLACLVGVASAKTDKKDTQAKSWVVDASHGTFSEQHLQRAAPHRGARVP